MDLEHREGRKSPDERNSPDTAPESTGQGTRVQQQQSWGPKGFPRAPLQSCSKCSTRIWAAASLTDVCRTVWLLSAPGGVDATLSVGWSWLEWLFAGGNAGGLFAGSLDSKGQGLTCSLRVQSFTGWREVCFSLIFAGEGCGACSCVVQELLCCCSCTVKVELRTLRFNYWERVGKSKNNNWARAVLLARGQSSWFKNLCTVWLEHKISLYTGGMKMVVRQDVLSKYDLLKWNAS